MKKCIYNNSVAVITGGASGVGKALSEDLASRGCHLALADINRHGLDAVQESLKAKYPAISISTHIVNVSSYEEIIRLKGEVLRIFGKVNFLFNIAGITLAESTRSGSLKDFEKVMSVNFMGPVLGTKVFLDCLLEQDNAHVVNISSIFGLVAYPSQAAYCASKSALKGFTESLAIEFRKSHIKFHSVHSGFVSTNILQNGILNDTSAVVDSVDEYIQAFDELTLLTPEAASKAILRGINKGKSEILVGKDAVILSWLQRFFPTRYKSILGWGIDIYRKLLRVRKSKFEPVSTNCKSTNKKEIDYFLVYLVIFGGTVALISLWFLGRLFIAGDFSFLPFLIGNIVLIYFGASVAYHRYFSHQSFKTSSGFELFLIFSALYAQQGGIRRWVARHRQHHRYSDTAKDPHHHNNSKFFLLVGNNYMKRPGIEDTAALKKFAADYENRKLINLYHSSE